MQMRILETERLILRGWDITDINDLYEYAQSELVGPNAGWKAHGSMGMHRYYPNDESRELNQREIGYVLNHKYWGNGYIPEAVTYIIEHYYLQFH